METAIGNTAPVPVLSKQGVFAMSKEEARICYLTSLNLFKKMVGDGLFSMEDLVAIDTIIAEKYDISLSSIYREKDLNCTQIRANIP